MTARFFMRRAELLALDDSEAAVVPLAACMTMTDKPSDGERDRGQRQPHVEPP
jgi:hypothetical protein